MNYDPLRRSHDASRGAWHKTKILSWTISANSVRCVSDMAMHSLRRHVLWSVDEAIFIDDMMSDNKEVGTGELQDCVTTATLDRNMPGLT